MQSLTEKISWYKEPEDRKWKRIWHCVELLLISLSAVAVEGVMQWYGNGTKFQPIFMLFTFIIALSTFGMALSVYSSLELKRWQIQLIILGLGCGAGISAIAGFVILELQLVSS
jgi:predicted Abi (CAAX) family protease